MYLSLFALVVLLGAGCESSSRGSASIPSSFSTGEATDNPLMRGGDQASKVPADVPVYPGGTVILVTGGGSDVSVAQETPHSSDRVVQWIKDAFARRSVSYLSTTVTGRSTNLVFESADRRYSVRVDAPIDAGGAYLTITRGKK